MDESFPHPADGGPDDVDVQDPHRAEEPGRDRAAARRLTAVAPTCEPLEGRRLLSGSDWVFWGKPPSPPPSSATGQTNPGPAVVLQPGGEWSFWHGTAGGEAKVTPLPLPPGYGPDGPITPSGETPALSRDFHKLNADLQNFLDKSQVTPALHAPVAADFQRIQAEATRPADASAVMKLIDDLWVLGGAQPDAARQAQIRAEFEAVVRSEGVNDPALADKTVVDAVALAAATRINPADVKALQADGAAVASDGGTINLPSDPGAPAGQAMPPAPGPFPGGPLGEVFRGFLGPKGAGSTTPAPGVGRFGAPFWV
jgi:hypothetical protein